MVPMQLVQLYRHNRLGELSTQERQMALLIVNKWVGYFEMHYNRQISMISMDGETGETKESVTVTWHEARQIKQALDHLELSSD
jgi:hypothetical protein